MLTIKLQLTDFIYLNCQWCSNACICLLACTADSGEQDTLAMSTADEEIPIDTEFSDYVDVECRTADFITAASDTDLFVDGLQSNDMAGASAGITKWDWFIGVFAITYLLIAHLFIWKMLIVNFTGVIILFCSLVWQILIGNYRWWWYDR